MTGSIAKRYAKALFALAREEGALEKTAQALHRLAVIAADPEIGPQLANPLLSAKTRAALARTLRDRLDLGTTTGNFVGLLARHQRLDQLPGIADTYQRLVDQELGQTRATLTSATSLEETQRTAMIEKLQDMTQKKVLADYQIDPQLLGGVIVEIEGRVFDGSVRTQLEKLATCVASERSYL